MSIYKYWGKASEDAYHLLVYHCLDVAAVGKVWLEQSPAFLKRAAKASGLTEQAFAELFIFFLALHDLGKFDVGFQNLRKDLLWDLQEKKGEYPYSPRHDQRGFEFWEEHFFQYLHNKLFAGVSEIPLKEYFDVFALVALGHHGTPPDKKSYHDKVSPVLYEYCDELLKVFVSEESIIQIHTLMMSKVERRSAMSTLKYFSWELAGLTTLCDWIASGDDSFTYCQNEMPLPAYFEQACEKAKYALIQAETVATPLSSLHGMKHLFPLYTEPTPLQAYCDTVAVTDKPQLWILEDVAGAGKTEAALTLASRILGAGGGAGCFVALPTMATSNAMYERMAQVYSLLFEKGSRPTLSLSHGSKHLSKTFCESYRTNFDDLPHEGQLFDERTDEGKAHCSQWLADSSKKALLSDVGVGTVDQILMAGLPVRYQSLRAFGMAQKVLIIDEVHSFDAYMLRHLENVIAAQAAFGGSVILLSATLALSVRKRFCKAFSEGLGIDSVVPKKKDVFPLVTMVHQNGILEEGVATRTRVAREVGVTFCEDIETVYALIQKSVAEGKCVCWIRNTISDVTDSFVELQNKGIENLDMFHSRFALKDRLAIEQRVIERFGKSSTPEQRTGQVLVASQVVEQSLDLDFDVMISDLAPIDLLIQRAGRLHRHQRGERDKPVLYVHTPKDTDEPKANWFSESFPKASFVYKDTAMLWRTKEILKLQKRLKMPEEARLLIESVYGDDGLETPEIFIKAEDTVWAETLNKKSIADFNRLKFELGYSRMGNDMGKWESDERVSTRLSEPTNSMYLCRWEHGQIVPFFAGESFAWDLSSLSLRTYSLESIEYRAEIMSAIEELKKQKRFQYSTVFAVFENEADELYGKDGGGKDVLVNYSQSNGLTVVKT